MAKKKFIILKLTLTILFFGTVLMEAQTPQLLSHCGVYRSGKAGEIVISLRKQGDQSILILTDLRTDIIRGMFPRGDDTFVLGKELIQPEPAEYKVVFVRNEEEVIQSLELTELSTHYTISAEKLPRRIVPVEFTNGSVVLKGDLYLPDGKSVYPAVVLAHGSEESDRYSFDALPHVLVNRGIAVLCYDKRGTGESTGSWQDSGIEPLAEDLHSGIELLRQRKEIDEKRIGIIGFSEGGWVAPLAASRSSSVSFIVSISGGGFTKGHSFLYKYRKQFQEEGLSGATLEKAIAQKEAIVAASAERVRKNNHATGFDRRITYDPAEDWKSFQKPVLYIAGELDVLEPVVESSARLHRILAENRNPDFTIKIFPQANHAMFLASSDKPSEFRTMKGIKQFVPGYWDTLLQWLQNRIL